MRKGPVLLTGASGFIGHHLARALAVAGTEVRYLLRSEASANRLPQHRPEQIFWGDVLDIFSLEAALQGCSAVIHAAAKVSFQSADTDEMWAVNEMGTANLINAALAREVDHFVHLSSVAALHRESGKLTTLDDRWQEGPAATVYEQTKFAAEREVWRGQGEGLNVSILYPSTVIGPGDWLRPGTPRLFHRAHRGMLLAPAGQAGFVSIEDVVEAVLYALTTDRIGLRILLNATNLSWSDALSQIAASVNAKAPGIQLPSWASASLWPLSTIAGKLMGTPPRISRDLHRTASAQYRYDGSSYTLETGRAYSSIEEAIRRTGEVYLREMRGRG